jgi:hypothetical protein
LPEEMPTSDPGRSDADRSDAAAATSASDEDARLAILRALARGDLTVAEAAVRIDPLEGTPDD